jgi:hypothetical protein
MEDKIALINDLRQTEKEPTDTQECPICFETYNATHEPVVLECTHFLCHDCAKNMINQPCPFCNKPVSITAVSLQIHLTNTYNPDEDKEISCSICEENFRRGEDVDRNACSQHIFHDACINRLIQGYFEKRNEGQCPRCKKSIVLNLFFQAVEKGDYQLVTNFIELGINVIIKDKYKALMIASNKGYSEELVARSIKHATTQYDNALRKAVYHGHAEIVSLLIINGANVNARDSLGGFTPLITAAQRGHTKIARLLILNGAYIDAQDCYGRTALMWSVTHSHFETMIELILRFADIDVQDTFGETALSRAYCKKPAEVAQHWANQLLHNKKRQSIDNMVIIKD